jgi:hypothetical protein
VINAKTLNSFKNRLEKFWQHQDIVNDYTAEIETGSHSHTNKDRNIILEPSEEDHHKTCAGNHQKVNMSI